MKRIFTIAVMVAMITALCGCSLSEGEQEQEQDQSQEQNTEIFKNKVHKIEVRFLELKTMRKQ